MADLCHGLKRHPELWYDDGSIVLVAENTCFKVHRTVLSRCSSVFSGMFSIPQPVAETESDAHMVDGCPAIYFYDAPDELASFLSMLYGGFRFMQKGPLNWSDVRAMLRLGDKYQVRDIYDAALMMLRNAFSRNFPLEDTSELCTRNRHLNNRFVVYTESDLPDIANVARQFELFDVLSVVLYDYCSLGASKDELESKDKFPITLDSENLRCCALGMQRLSVVAHESLASTFTDPELEGRCTSGMCPLGRQDILGEMEVLVETHGHLALQYLTEMLIQATSVLCWSCCEDIDHRLNIAIYALFKNLGDYFDINPKVSSCVTAD